LHQPSEIIQEGLLDLNLKKNSKNYLLVPLKKVSDGLVYELDCDAILQMSGDK
jgi:hypothetical protein